MRREGSQVPMMMMMVMIILIVGFVFVQDSVSIQRPVNQEMNAYSVNPNECVNRLNIYAAAQLTL